MAKKPKLPRVPFRTDGPINPHLSMRQHRDIGRVIAIWSDLEAVIEIAIWDLFGVDMEHGKIITRRLNIEARLQTLKALGAMHYNSEKMARLDGVISRINEVKDDRNFIVHGQWFRDQNGLAVSSSTRPKSDPFTVVAESFPPKRMRSVHLEISLIVGAFVEFMDPPLEQV